jgi:hypothetical protein
MTGPGWRCVEAVAGLLDAPEREVLLGDLAETDRGVWQGLSDVLNLAARRQMLLWRSWQPWAAALGWALPASFVLIGLSLAVSRGALHLVSAGPVSGWRTGTFLCQLCLVAGWSWTGGYMAGSLSRRTLWATLALSLAPCLFCLSRFHIDGLSPFSLVLFLVPVGYGLHLGLCRVRIAPGAAIWLAVVLTVLAVPFWSGLPIYAVALLWPAWYIAARARGPSREVRPLTE